TRFPVKPLMKCIWKKKWSLKFIPKAILNMILLGVVKTGRDRGVVIGGKEEVVESG
nr:hypothetical protein [Tanacetum cinerariifolium]GEY29292.1 hypothetical protein [Tanacetum cinerariifolium]